MITKPFLPLNEIYADGSTRMQDVLHRIMALSDDDVSETLNDSRELFAGRHRDLEAVFDRSFCVVAEHLDGPGLGRTALSDDRRQLIGAYFTHEYSVEAAALVNPSIVAAPDQSGLAAGELRFVMSLRSIGEGHTSSIEFRTGVISADATVRLDPPSAYAVTGTRDPHEHHKSLFTAKLDDLGMMNEVEAVVLARLRDRFTIAELEAAIQALEDDGIERSISGETTRLLHWLASSNYRRVVPDRDRHLRARPVPERPH